jgi:hypothetical protein
MPAVQPGPGNGNYDIYPSFNIGEGKIFRGFKSLATQAADSNLVIIDGFEGIFFEDIKNELDPILRNDHNIEALWISTSDLLKPEGEINSMISPFLGGDDPLFGKRSDLTLKEFFDPEKLKVHIRNGKALHYIIYGIGAALFSENGLVVYFDLPKNELQFRARAGTVTNLGASSSFNLQEMYKRFYFVDWVVLNRHKQEILERIDILTDGQRNNDITWISGDDFRNSLKEMSRVPVRVRPWFEPGTWGGTWIKDNIAGLNKDVANYAWSFELITPENGFILESSGLLVEFSFDFLMYSEAKNILGKSHKRFGTVFPIRFDFLDTFDGGNLSIQCHPRPE